MNVDCNSLRPEWKIFHSTCFFLLTTPKNTCVCSDEILDIELFPSLRNCLHLDVYNYYFPINILLMGPSIIFHIYGHAYFLGLSWSQDPFRIRTNGMNRVPWRKEMPDYGNEGETQNFTTPLEKLRMQLCLCSSNTRGSMTKQRKQREKKTKR